MIIFSKNNLIDKKIHCPQLCIDKKTDRKENSSGERLFFECPFFFVRNAQIFKFYLIFVDLSNKNK
jgi:hypothetical protein